MTDPPKRRRKSTPAKPVAAPAPSPPEPAPEPAPESPMDIHKPKPVHSPREFLAELGVIVLGILIALAAEQTVEALHWRHEVADAREAMVHEVTANLRILEVLRRQDQCRVRILAGLDETARGAAPLNL